MDSTNFFTLESKYLISYSYFQVCDAKRNTAYWVYYKDIEW